LQYLTLWNIGIERFFDWRCHCQVVLGINAVLVMNHVSTANSALLCIPFVLWYNTCIDINHDAWNGRVFKQLRQSDARKNDAKRAKCSNNSV